MIYFSTAKAVGRLTKLTRRCIESVTIAFLLVQRVFKNVACVKYCTVFDQSAAAQYFRELYPLTVGWEGTAVLEQKFRPGSSSGNRIRFFKRLRYH